MMIQLNATEGQINATLRLISTNADLAEIANQLKNSLAQIDDTQSHEIPEEGDNATIKRFE